MQQALCAANLCWALVSAQSMLSKRASVWATKESFA